MTAALSDPTLVVLIVAAFFAFLALVALARKLTGGRAHWRRFRVGVFVERDGNGDDLDG